ncbi:MAG: flagellar hook assembly protein FlgD [Pseudobdellovibrionaceae bacterium]
MAVMGVKTGTKSYSDAVQNEVVKGTNGPKTNSAQDLAKFGDENVGDLLNKIADPNWVDPLKKMRTAGSDKMDKDSFMKLMIAQMKHQDPTNPMQSHELAAQLAQFSSVEQLQNVNKTLEGMAEGQKPTEGFQALNFIGKAVSGDSSKLVRVKGDRTHDYSYSLNGDASAAKFKVRNSTGEIIRTVDLKDIKKGPNSLTWNGLDDRGQPAPAGEYQFFLEATNVSGAKLAVKTDFEGVISGLNYTPEGPVLLVGTQSIKLKDVKKIVDPSLMKNDQKAKNPSGQDLLKQPVASQNEVTADEEKRAGDPEAPPASNVMNNVGMSRDMLSKLEKETRPDSSPSQKQ